ncbi:hypothetical protein D3C81_1997360 [compost metagenome]
MDHQQQTLATACQASVQHPQQRAVFQVQAALGALDGVLQGGAVGEGFLPQHGRLRRFFRCRVTLRPAACNLYEAQPQGLVTDHQVLHGPL